MPRLQVLHLPSRETDADRFVPCFALVLDDCADPMSDAEVADARRFAEEIGASALWVTARKVAIDQGEQRAEDPARVTIEWNPTDESDPVAQGILDAVKDVVRAGYSGDPRAMLAAGVR